jgi:hypothetical protein
VRYTVFCICGKEGVNEGEIGDVLARSEDSMKHWLVDKVFVGKESVALLERDYLDAFKTTIFEVGKEKINRVVYIRGVEAEDGETARKFGESFIVEEPGKPLVTFAFSSFMEIVDPVNVEGEPVHHVRGSKRQSGYWRRVPYHYGLPTDNMREARRILTKTAFTQGRDKVGIVAIVDDEGKTKEIPASAKPVKDSMNGLKIAKPTPIVVTLQLSPLDRLRKLTEILARAGT